MPLKIERDKDKTLIAKKLSEQVGVSKLRAFYL